MLKNKKLLSQDQIVSPELVLYEVSNSIWKHEHLLKDLKDGEPYLASLYGLIAARKITIISPNENLMNKAYSMAKQNNITIYDAIFISLAFELGVILKTFDKAQISALESERKKGQHTN